MSYVPLLSDPQWSRIENILPENRQDRTVITAILYLAIAASHCAMSASSTGFRKPACTGGTVRSRPMAPWGGSWRR